MSTPHPPPPQSQQPLLPDILGRPKHINVFSSLTRDTPFVNELLSSSSQYAIILAPQNSAITALPQKPWEDDAQYKKFGVEAFEGELGMERARSNLEKFVERYIGVFKEGDEKLWQAGKKIRTMRGEEVWWEERNGKRTVMPWDVEVLGEIERVANGELWVLKELRK